MPRSRHVLDAQLAPVAYKREMQLVTHAVEFVGGWSLACLWRFPAHFADHQCIAGHCVVAPNIGFAVFVEIDLEGSVWVKRPHGAKRVCPITRQRGWTGLWAGRACT